MDEDGQKPPHLTPTPSHPHTSQRGISLSHTGHSKLRFDQAGGTSLLRERALWFAWSQIPGMGPILQKRMAQHFGSLDAAWAASPDQLLSVEGIGLKVAWAIAEHRPKIDLAAVDRAPGKLVTPADLAYPDLLYEIPDPPPVLYYDGNLDLLAACQQRPAVGIVGTRSPSEYGKRWTRRLTKTLCQAGFPIVSGLADGIDRVAHESCLEANGQTIAVLGTGVDVFYPYRNRDLHREISRLGLLVSEHPPGTQPEKVHFPRRNRIIAGLSRATLVTEAPRKSGALITTKLANDYGRDVFCAARFARQSPLLRLPGYLESRCPDDFARRYLNRSARRNSSRIASTERPDSSSRSTAPLANGIAGNDDRSAIARRHCATGERFVHR